MDLPNVIVIIVDSLRKDYAKPLEDALTKLGFISYENAIAPAPWTVPSHASIFTGLYPAFHGAHETKNRKIPNIRLVKTSNLITFKLKNLGYENILLTANFFVHPQFGFVGFDHVHYVAPISEFSLLSKIEKEKLQKIMGKDNSNLISLVKNLLYNKQYKILIKCSIQYLINRLYRYFSAIFKNWPTEKGVTRIINYLDKYLEKKELKRSNNFIFINMIEMHEPYFIHDNLRILSEHLKTNDLNPDYANKWKLKYKKEVFYITKKIINLINILKKHDIFDNSLIIVTSDHGQLLGEYGKIGHGNFLYDELLKVPLLIKYPKDIRINSKYVENSQTWISLTRLKRFILSLIKDNNDKADELLFNNIAFSESYGIAGRVSITTEDEKKNIEQLEKYRIAIYYKNFKGIFNVSDWDFEEVISYGHKTDITDDVTKCMKKEIVRFLNMATSIKKLKLNK